MENKPITCPNCKNENINFSIIRIKSNIVRFLKYTCIILMIMMIGLTVLEFAQNTTALKLSSNDQSYEFAIIRSDEIEGRILGFRVFSICAILLQGLQIFIERKEKIQCICKNCSHAWTIK